MTNNWTDIGNASLVFVMGANPSENHPACMAHINRARDRGGKLVVVDPRKTRTAVLADKYIRIRPGTDIAFINGVLRGIIADMEARALTDAQRVKFYEFLNYAAAWPFYTDGSATTPSSYISVPGSSKYTDARFIVKDDGSDYERETVVAATGAPAVGTEAPNEIISNFPKKGANVFTAKTVYQRLKAHVASYEPSVVRDICGCAEADIAYVVSAFIANSRCSSPAAATAATQDPTVANYKATTMLYAMGLTQHTYGSQNVKSFATLQTLMGNMGRAGGGINALRGIHNVQGSTDMGNLYHLIPFYSGNPTVMTAQSVTELGTESAVLSAGTIDGTAYAGFAEPMTAADGNAAGALVLVLANKDASVPATMAEALNPARWDVLAYRATNIASVATYTYLGKSDLSTKAAAAMAGVPLPGDICFDGTVFRAYVPSATTGKLYELTSADGLTWTAGATVYDTTAAVQYPTVMSDGTTTRVYYYDGAGISYLPLTIGTATPGAATQVIASGQDPKIEYVSGKYVLTYQKHPNGIYQASATYPAGPFIGAQVWDNDAYDSIDGLATVAGKILFTPRTGPQPANITNKPLKGLTPNTLKAVNAFGKYMDALWGMPVWGTAKRTLMDGSYDDAYNDGTGAIGTAPLFDKVLSLQQRGFLNMTYNFFGDVSWIGGTALPRTPANRELTDALYDLWPKTNGDDHITMFRKMTAGTIKACLCWGQNPAVTEPNQSEVRKGLYNLDMLAVVDMFATETAAVSRKPGSTTYLIPACSHVEEAGSVSNSGRVLQWRERAALPKGKSKSDLELLFRFAYALDKPAVNAFSHIKAQWTAKTTLIPGGAPAGFYAAMYGNRYGWTPGGATAFEDVSGTAEVWRGAEATPRVAGTIYDGDTVAWDGAVKGSEWIAEQVYRELNTGIVGTSWLYVRAYDANRTTDKHTGQGDWAVANRSKSRSTADPNRTLAYPGWGYSWLVNRRVLYNNTEVPGDVADYFMGPDSCGRLYVTSTPAKGRDLNYSRWYRFYHTLADMPDTCLGGIPKAPHVFPGRFQSHTEPYETPYEALATTWGRNTKGTAKWDLVKSDTKVAAPGRSHTASEFPLVLTTIRCVEHFQGGPITRNNPWNVEAEPEPWVEINSVDALALGISDGEYVNIVTARADSLGTLTRDVEARFKQAGWAQGFKARVQSGTQGNQRVAPGVVAIPWHWGDQGLSKGSRANDLCIDAGDANTVIPESKACLCKIVKKS